MLPSLIAISLIIGRDAFSRLFHPESLRTSVMLIAALARAGRQLGVGRASERSQPR